MGVRHPRLLGSLEPRRKKLDSLKSENAIFAIRSLPVLST